MMPKHENAWIAISLHHFGISSSRRLRGLHLGRFPIAGITSALIWGAVGAILLTCDQLYLILFMFAVCSAGCIFTRRIMSSFRILSILVFPAAFLRHIISVKSKQQVGYSTRIQDVRRSGQIPGLKDSCSRVRDAQGWRPWRKKWMV